MALLNTRQIGDQLSVSPRTVRRWIASGQLPGLRLVGGQWRVSEQRLAEVVGGNLGPELRPAA